MLKLRIEELESRNYENLLNHYKNVIAGYASDIQNLREEMNKSTLRYRDTLNYTDTPAWKEVVETLSNKDKLLENMKERNTKLSVDYLDANTKINNYTMTLQDYEKINKLLKDLENENKNLKPRVNELMEFKVDAERRIHDLREDMIRNDGEHSRLYDSRDNSALRDYKERINSLEEQLENYKSREKDMTHKLDKFRSDLDIANFKMSEFKQPNYDSSYVSQSQFNTYQNDSIDSGRRTDSWKKSSTNNYVTNTYNSNDVPRNLRTSNDLTYSNDNANMQVDDSLEFKNLYQQENLNRSSYDSGKTIDTAIEE